MLQDFVVSARFPFGWMNHCSGPDHVQVDKDEAADQVFVPLDGSCMITVFPKGAFPRFALIELLSGSAGDQLHAFRNGVRFGIDHQ